MSKLLFRIVFICLAASYSSAIAGELTGEVTFEGQLFAKESIYDGPGQATGSIIIEGEYYHQWDDYSQQLVFSPYLRLNYHDKEKSLFDIRELFWQKLFDSWEISVGLKKVYWGQTESLHLVDFINQTDFAEGVDGEEKLGQPMVQAVIVKDFGTFEFYWLPYFRERTFVGVNSRLRPFLAVNKELVSYQSQAKEWHQDFAVRYYNTFGQVDIGLSYFKGTNREPELGVVLVDNFYINLAPTYLQIDRIGIDMLMVAGGWLLKFEAINQKLNGVSHSAFVAGYEYTIVGLLGSRYDLGILTEYMYDERGTEKTSFENDIFIGARLALNDAGSSSILSGAIIDTKTRSTLFLTEAEKRLGSSVSLEAELRLFIKTDKSEILYFLRDDDFLRIDLTKYF